MIVCILCCYVENESKSSIPSATDDFLSGLFGGSATSSSTSASTVEKKSDDPGVSFADDLLAQDLAAFVTDDDGNDSKKASDHRRSKSSVSALLALAPPSKSNVKREKEPISAEDLAKLMGDLPDFTFMLSKEISRK